MRLTNIIKRKFLAISMAVFALSATAASVGAFSASNGDFEAESVTSGFNRMTFAFRDSKASGGKAVVLYTNATISKTVKTPDVSAISVYAKGIQCKGAPKMTVKVDGKTVMSNQPVSAKTYTKYTHPADIDAGSHRVEVSFTNDGGGWLCNRDLYIDKVEFEKTASEGGDTTPPTVSIINPSNGAIVKGAIPVQANASDKVGVTKVEFYMDGSNIPAKTEVTAPYCLAGDNGTTCNGWDTNASVANGSHVVPDGTHSFIAKAYDAAGNFSISPTVTFTVKNEVTPPTTLKIVPVTDSNASGGKALAFNTNGRAKKTTTTPQVSAISVTARGDQCNGAPQMTVKIDGNVVLNAAVSTTTYTKYSAPLTNVAAGSHAVAIEYANDFSQTSCDRNLYVDKVEFTAVPNTDTVAPSVSITNPKDGTTVSGTVPVQASATDNVGVTSVEFFLDNGNSPISTQKSAPYCLAGASGTTCNNWDTATTANGAHKLTAKAFDAAGNVSASTVNFTVNNQTGTKPPPPPTPGPTVGLAQLLKDDMTKPAELVPSGPPIVSWYQNPRLQSSTPRAGFNSMMAWGTLFEGVGGNPQPNARAEIRDITAWFRSASSGQWSQMQYTQNTTGAMYATSWNNSTRSPDAHTNSAGSTSISGAVPGWTYHFYPAMGRGVYNPGDFGGMIITVRARLEPGTYNPAQPVGFTLDAGADWWRCPSCSWKSDWSQNSDAGTGRFKRVESTWRLYTFTTLTNPSSVALPPINVNPSELR